MLVLTRKERQRVLMPQHNIAVEVVEICGDRVRIGVSAPAEVGVYREEVWVRLQRGRSGAEATLADQ